MRRRRRGWSITRQPFFRAEPACALVVVVRGGGGDGDGRERKRDRPSERDGDGDGNTLCDGDGETDEGRVRRQDVGAADANGPAGERTCWRVPAASTTECLITVLSAHTHGTRPRIRPPTRKPTRRRADRVQCCHRGGDPTPCPPSSARARTDGGKRRGALKKKKHNFKKRLLRVVFELLVFFSISRRFENNAVVVLPFSPTAYLTRARRVQRESVGMPVRRNYPNSGSRFYATVEPEPVKPHRFPLRRLIRWVFFFFFCRSRCVYGRVRKCFAKALSKRKTFN